MVPAAIKIKAAMTTPAIFSALPWPKGCCLSGGLPAILMPMKPTIAPTRSIALWMASALMAILPVTILATTFMAIRKLTATMDSLAVFSLVASITYAPLALAWGSRMSLPHSPLSQTISRLGAIKSEL
ncbi:hypothetical protein ES703_30505 [subsurface metagenome]